MTRTRLLLIATILATFFWCFGSVLFQNRSFGFRDAANYYYPLFEWECGEWGAGRVPLWNPLDNGGTPVLADTTSSVLYPGKLVFVLPVNFRLRYHLYVTAHVLLAAAMAYRLARHWDCSCEAAGLGALSYAFGGSVLFQYCNVVFLVGAAWLPYALLATDRMLRERSRGWALTLGATLALIVLGGDPQTAYHAGMLSALYALLLRYDGDARASKALVSWRRSRPALLAIAAITALSFAFVQVLPAIEWTRQSSRDSPEPQRNLYEVASSLAGGKATSSRDVATGLFITPKDGSHLQHAYEFSVGPWHLAEFVWPNFYGRVFPVNERWSTAIPAEGRTWTPSLYLGLLPLILAVCSWRLRRCDTRVRFMSLLTLLGILASFGAYGIGWFVHEVRVGILNSPPDQVTIGHPVGGLYWLFVTLLPGYVYFRYPAKLLVMASLGISMLAARGWDDFVAERSRRIAIPFIVLAAVSLFAAAAFGIFQSPWKTWLVDAPADLIFGPVDVERATSAVLAAMLHTAILGLVFWFVLRTNNQRVERVRGILLLGITALELCVANGWMTLSIPGSVWSEKRSIAEAIVEQADGFSPPRLYRQSAVSLLPVVWSQESDRQRLEQVVEWERATLLPKHHISANVAMIGSHTTLASADWESFLRVAREHERQDDRRQSNVLLNAMSARFIAASKRKRPTGNRSVVATTENDIRLLADSQAFPNTWIVHRVEILPPLADRSRTGIDQRTREVFFNNEQPRDLASVAIVETDEPLMPPRAVPAAGSIEVESCTIKHYSSQRVEIEVSLSAPGCVVLNDTFYLGWNAVRVTDGMTTELPIHRANRVMRAVLLPAGKHRVVFAYRPQRFMIGGVISGCAWLLALAYAIAVVRSLRNREAAKTSN